MNFVDEFIELIQRDRSNLLSMLGRRDPTRVEALLKDRLLSHWHELPEVSCTSLNEFSVDSSSASRTLVNGVDLFIIRALMLGSDGSRFRKVTFEVMRCITDPELSAKFERMMRDLIEIEIVVENHPEDSGGIILIDGNLYGRFTRIIRQVDIPGWEHLPLLLWEAMLRLFDICEKKDVLIAGVSKFSRTRGLSKALLHEAGHPFDALDMPDVEMIYRWRQGESGFSTPLILGDYGFRDEVQLMRESPDSYLQRNFPRLPKDLRKWGLKVVERVPHAPAIAMFHLVPAKEDHPIRVDVPVNCLGSSEQIGEVSPFRFSDPELVEDVIKQLQADRGGMDVYNALLYVVDREVRLVSGVVDRVYRSILSRELDMPIEYDRSSRRFNR